MKKIFAMLVLSLFAFSACSDFFIDVTAVHNGLVSRMDNLLSAEEAFYDQYVTIQEGDDAAQLVNYYDNFVFAADELDRYFTETNFASTQQIFIEQYNDFYKTKVQEYLALAGEFVDMVEKNGFVLADAEAYFDQLDQFGQDFVDVHNRLIDTINLQADPEL